VLHDLQLSRCRRHYRHSGTLSKWVKPLHSTVTRKAGRYWTSQLGDLREKHTHSCWSRVPVVTHYIRGQAKSPLSALSPLCRILKLLIASRSWMKWAGNVSPVSGEEEVIISTALYTLTRDGVPNARNLKRFSQSLSWKTRISKPRTRLDARRC
jgi:hypothetical protein